MNALTSKFKLDKSQIDGNIFREGHVPRKSDGVTRQPVVSKPALQVSTKHNVPAEKMNSPRKSILKTTSPLAEVVAKGTISGEKVKSPRKSILKDNIGGTGTQTTSHSPRTRKSVHDGETSSLEYGIPEIEMASPVPTFRRKNPENPIAPSSSPRLRSSTHVPIPSLNEKPDNTDLWTTIPESRPIVQVPSAMTTHHLPRIAPKLPESVPAVSTLPADVGSTVLEIQTGLRRDIERLRLDMLRQFVSFRSEMGQKWEGEVGRLRQENEMLKGEVESLRKEAGKRNDRSGWRLG